MLQGVHHIEFLVRDVDETKEYFKKLGFEVVRVTDHHGRAVEMRIPGDQVIFEFHTVAKSENPGVNLIAFKVDNLEATEGDLRSKGIPFDTDPQLVVLSGRAVANFRDPQGFRWQLTKVTD